MVENRAEKASLLFAQITDPSDQIYVLKLLERIVADQPQKAKPALILVSSRPAEPVDFLRRLG